MVSTQIIKATNRETQIVKRLILCEPINGFKLAASVDPKSTLGREIRGQIPLLLAYFIGEVRVFEVGIFVVDGSITGCVVGFSVDPHQLRCRRQARSHPRPRPSKAHLVACASWPSAWKINGLLPFVA